MSTNSLSAHVVHAADFVQRHHAHLAIDNPTMALAHETLRRAGVWSYADVDLPPATEPPHITVEMQGTFCAGDRRRIVYRLIVDGEQLGTATCWTAKTMYPWGLTIAHARIINLGFKTREDLVAAVHRFVQTGSV